MANHKTVFLSVVWGQYSDGDNDDDDNDPRDHYRG